MERDDVLSEEQEQFRPGSIHEEKYRKFWIGDLNASPWVVDTLTNGYAIPFNEIPGKYEEENNASAKKNMSEVRKIVAEMIEKGIVKVTKDKPKCISPLGLVSKLKDGKMKHRLVFDASRWLNNFIKDQRVTLSHLDKALEMTERNDWQTIFDLKSAYYHIKIREDQHELLGAAIENSDGSKLYFVYKHLPFGLKCAVHAITKIWKPIIATLQKMGIRSSIYIDDGRLLSRTKDEAEESRVKAYRLIQMAGWILEVEKSDKRNESDNMKLYLGFLVDTVKMTVTKPADRLDEIVRSCKVLRDKRKCSVKELSSVLGKVAALIPSHGQVARVSTRSGYVDVTRHVDQYGWKGELIISEECNTELKFFEEMALKCNGFPIKSEMHTMKVNIVFPDAKASKELLTVLGGEQVLDSDQVCRIASDSSSFKAAVLCLDSKENVTLDFMFTEEEQRASSGLRELLAIKKALEHFIHVSTMQQKLIFWATDSTNVVSFLEKGSSKKHVQKVVLCIAKSLAKLNSWIQPIHLYREDERIREADLVSKFRDSDDWSIDEISFQKLREKYDLSTDMFANSNNKRLETFISKFFEQGCSGVDAMCQKWDHGMWMCPPIGLLNKIANEVRRRKNCSGIILIPEWPTSTFYGKFFGNGETRLPFRLEEKIEPFIYQNQGATGALCGKVAFKLCVLSFSV